LRPEFQQVAAVVVSSDAKGEGAEGSGEKGQMEMATFTALRIPLSSDLVLRLDAEEPEPQPDIGQSRISKPLPFLLLWVRQYPLATINTSAPPTAPSWRGGAITQLHLQSV